MRDFADRYVGNDFVWTAQIYSIKYKSRKKNPAVSQYIVIDISGILCLELLFYDKLGRVSYYESC